MKTSQLPIIAIVGEPNVGKSTLMNKIAGKRQAVTSPIAGTTRDRQYIDTTWNGVSFTMVDTAGITFGKNDELELALNEQVDAAIDQADLLLFVVDSKAAASQVDRQTLQKFRKTKKPVILAINKMDSPKNIEEIVGSFQKLGIKTLFPVSAVNGRGMGDMLDSITEFITEHKLDQIPEEKTEGIAVAIVGKPNVGKSSILNKILGQKRVVVSTIPGTTRTAIDTYTTYEDNAYTFIDTAGLKKKEHRQKLPDIFSGFQTFKAIRRSDVVFLVVDATEPITKQDQHIAQEIFAMDRGVIILANKFDLYRGDEQQLRDYISKNLQFLWFSPLFLVSAKTGNGLEAAMTAIKPIYDNRLKEVSQDEINETLSRAYKKNPPRRMIDQKNPKVHSLAQIGSNPPMFELFVNYPAAISMQFRRYLQKQIIKELDFWGTPVKLKIRGKDKS